MTDKDIQDLIRLKRHEQPEEGYFDDFLAEFQQRQRSEMLNTSARGLFFERIKTRFSELGAMKWVAGAGLAYAAVALVLAVLPKTDAPNSITEQPASNAPSVGASHYSDKMQPVSMEMQRPVDFSGKQMDFADDGHVF